MQNIKFRPKKKNKNDLSMEFFLFEFGEYFDLWEDSYIFIIYVCVYYYDNIRNPRRGTIILFYFFVNFLWGPYKYYRETFLLYNVTFDETRINIYIYMKNCVWYILFFYLLFFRRDTQVSKYIYLILSNRFILNSFNIIITENGYIIYLYLYIGPVQKL